MIDDKVLYLYIMYWHNFVQVWHTMQLVASRLQHFTDPFFAIAFNLRSLAASRTTTSSSTASGTPHVQQLVSHGLGPVSLSPAQWSSESHSKLNSDGHTLPEVTGHSRHTYCIPKRPMGYYWLVIGRLASEDSCSASASADLLVRLQSQR